MKRKAIIPTHGLTHIALKVRDPAKALAFYRAILGVAPVYQSKDWIQAQTPGTRDVLVFERAKRGAGKAGGVAHFGFRLKRAVDIERARNAITNAGGLITETGEFVPGEPYVFFKDPDGYLVEIWYEIPAKGSH
jgi:catechol 2,3-dioxygenase-like lactoylglutathione lyase family enzyme